MNEAVKERTSSQSEAGATAPAPAAAAPSQPTAQRSRAAKFFSRTWALRWYFVRRIVRFFITVWLGLTIIFIVPRLGPTNPVDAILARMVQASGSVDGSKALIAHYTEVFGLNLPIWQQYLHYLYAMATFDLGYSLSNFPAKVNDLIAAAAPWTIGVVLAAILIAFAVGSMIGAILGWARTPRWLRRSLPITLLVSALPAFIIGMLLLWIFSFTLRWLPSTGAYDAGLQPGWNPEFIGSVIQHALLPVAAIAAAAIGGWALSMRGMMVTNSGEDYTFVAGAKGLRPSRIFWAYGVRNSLLPQVTALGFALGGIAGGAVVTEAVFGYPGLGNLLYTAILASDYTLIEGIAFYLIVGVALAGLILDLFVYPLLDPRIRIEGRK